MLVFFYNRSQISIELILMKKLIPLFLLIFSCAPQQNYEVDNGTFKGNLPCESCDHIETTLILDNDQTYTLKQIKIGDDKNEIADTINGSFVITKKEPNSQTEFKLGMLVLYQDNNPIKNFKIINKKRLEILDMDGNEIDKIKDYTLDKEE